MFEFNAPATAAVYCRVSSEVQAERQTIESQVDFAEKYCSLNGIEIAKIYRDDGITGTLPLQDRPAGAELLADAKAGAFSLVLIFKLDRLGRSTRVILNAVHDLDAMNIKVRSMTEPFDTSNASGRFLLTILAGVADLERSNILQRMDLGATRAAKEGKWLGGIVPYGYIKNAEGFLEVNENTIPGFDMSEADVVRMMFRMCANEGCSSGKIVDHLNALGIPPAWVAHGLGGKRRNNTSGFWGSSRVLRILHATTYKGIHEYGQRSPRGRETIKREVPAIVDADVWAKAQKVLKGNKIEAMKNTKNRYLLKSLIKCANCGFTYRGNAASSTCKHGYYSCGGRSNWKRRESMKEKCTGMSINMDWLDNFVWDDCLKFINNPDLVINSIDAAAKKTIEDEKTIKLLRGRLAELDADHERMLDLYRQKIIDVSDLTGQLDKIKKDREAVTAELRQLENRRVSERFFEAKETAVNMLELLQKAVSNPDIDFDIKQAVIRAMVEKITVSTDNSGANPRAHIIIHYKFHDETLADFTRTDIRKGMDWPQQSESDWPGMSWYHVLWLSLSFCLPQAREAPPTTFCQTPAVHRETTRHYAPASLPRALAHCRRQSWPPSRSYDGDCGKDVP